MNNHQNIHCPHFAICSGCTIGEKVNNPPILEEIRQYFSDRSVAFDYVSGQSTEWRNRAKLAIRGTKQNPLIGLYKSGTHEIVNIPFCQVHHPAINQAVEQIKKWIVAEGINPYDEITYQGVLRYIQCVVERSTGLVQLGLVLNSETETFERQIQSLWNSCPSLWNSIWVNFNTQRTNVIFGQEWKLIKGSDYVCEKLAGVNVYFHPANFAQANLTVFEKMLMDIKARLPEKKRVVEYYAGVGVIGLSVADKAATVICSEINPYAEAAFEKSRSFHALKNISFYTGSVVDHTHFLQESDVVIVDPPRKGLDRVLVDALLENDNCKELMYISCGWTSFKKDCERLKDRWKMDRAKGYLFFPGTDHLEVFVTFKKT